MMKKVILMLVMLFTICSGVFAEDVNVVETENFEKYDFNVNFKKLALFLNLSENQTEMVNEISSELAKDMEFAFYENKDEARKNVVKNVIDKNIRNMFYALDNDQYHRYIRVLNATLKNKGFLPF